MKKHAILKEGIFCKIRLDCVVGKEITRFEFHGTVEAVQERQSNTLFKKGNKGKYALTKYLTSLDERPKVDILGIKIFGPITTGLITRRKT